MRIQCLVRLQGAGCGESFIPGGRKREGDVNKDFIEQTHRFKNKLVATSGEKGKGQRYRG